MFDWDEANIGHIAGRGISPAEAEEAVSDPYRVPAPAYRAGTEQRRAVLGRSEDRRLLFIVTTRRGASVRVVTARDATDGERRRYRDRGK